MDSINYSIDYFYRVKDIPKTDEEANKSTEKLKWEKAMSDEIKALKEKDTRQETYWRQRQRCSKIRTE